MSETAATENDWVCDLAKRPTDLFTFGTVGLIVGMAIFFSYLAFWSRTKAKKIHYLANN